MQRRLNTAKRIEFDNGVLVQLRVAETPKPQRRALPSVRLLFPLLLLLAGAAAAGGAFWLYLTPGEDFDKLERMSVTIIEALRNNQIEHAVALCADSPEGSLLLSEECRRALQDGSEAEGFDGQGVPCGPFLESIRQGLAAQGGDWTSVEALGFGGVKAELQAGTAMEDSAVSVVGEIYFALGDAVYALELSARRCLGTYVITDFWRCDRVDTTPDTLKAYAKERFARELDSPASTADGPSIASPKPIYIGF